MDRNVGFFKELQTGGGPAEAGAMPIDLGYFKLRRNASEKSWRPHGLASCLAHLGPTGPVQSFSL